MSSSSRAQISGRSSAQSRKRRQLDREHVEPVVEIGPEGALVDPLLQVDIGRGDDAKIDFGDLVRSDWLDFALLQHAQQLDLQLQRHFADLVEEQGAAVGGPELAVAALAIGARIRTRRDAKKFGFDQRVGNGGDIDADEGFFGTRRTHCGSPGPAVPCRCRFRPTAARSRFVAPRGRPVPWLAQCRRWCRHNRRR